MSEKKKKTGKWTRRAFIIAGGVAGGGLIAGVGGMIHMNRKIKQFSGEGFGDGKSINAWVRISPDNTVTIAVPRAEMGQGVYTSIPMLIAEELEVPMSSIKVIHPQAESPYANTFFLANQPRDIHAGLSIIEKIASYIPVIGTGGSTTIRDGYDNLRASGAIAREMLIGAAANKWSVNSSDCYAENGYVINTASKEKLSYGELAVEAAKIEIDEIPTLKTKDFKIIGKPVQRLDIPEKVVGKAEFGVDVRPEGLMYAVVRHATYFDGVINAVKNTEEIEAMPGVKKVLLLAEGMGVAVVADNTWRAKNAANKLKLDETGDNSINSASIAEMQKDVIANKLIANPQVKGDVSAALSSEEGVVSAEYSVPYLDHATMEPINCTVLVKDGKAEVWAGHQATSVLHSTVSDITGFDKENVRTNITYLGGGFGRRAEIDMVKMASEVAKEMEGTPVQLMITREQGMLNGMYRPAVASNFRGKLSAGGEIEAWENKMALQSVSYSSLTRILPAMAEPPEKDPSSSEGAANLPYAMDSVSVSFGQIDLPIQVGNWRSVGSSQNAFFTESFLDELAYEAKQDPYLFRKAKLKDKPRFEAVLDAVAKMSNWSEPLPEGKFRGIALAESFGSIVGEVAEISKIGEKEFKIDKFFCAIDCGRTVNPDTIKAQMQGSIIYGLSAALYGEITIDKGVAQQTNFPQYEMVRMKVSPKIIDVQILDVDEYPGGVGEPGLPPAAPALTNAIFAATGERIRSLPLNKKGYTFS